ncbi:F-box/LRR-repeat protein 3 [Tribolium castaneum]|uniref:F-box only protein 39-like Protein n=1 Tax=Tribolium castaneum TaxID=7070 RepID=D6WI14_TRICA|nr:PREDICTED: F-box/LRR-repeat protein 3 [Tribolium castaneum]EEZ99707.1 F-box only protein 39-like Protein [Tribolium castaneum]|eukprot:XP_015834167.1 PREDICTED: F-box/LRR-repeat protein 3 [Tribolium castaneum]
MGDWENLPVELLAHLYSYLSRRDRLSCSLVCENWKSGLDHVILWKTVIVHVDSDLMEPSTVILLRDYCKYIKNLEFGWAVPHRNNKWAQVRYKELTKRAVRFFLVLYDNYIQIHSLRIFNWFDFMSFQKVTYHLSRFLKNQVSLKKIIFDNINMHSANYMKVLTSCLGSRGTITHLDIRSCYYCQSSFDAIYFRSCIEQLTYLKSFKLDYFILSCRLIDSILTSKNRSLEHLEIVLKETSWHDHVIDDEQWCLLCSACPNLKVTLIIRNVYHYGELRLYLKQSIPIVSLSIILPRVMDRGGRWNFGKTLNLLVSNYHRTLETIDLHIKNDGEVVDDVLLRLIHRCSKLKSFLFNGYLENPQLLKSSFSDITFFCMTPNSLPDKHLVFNKVIRDDVTELRHKRVQFTLIKRSPKSICSLLVLN